MTGALVWLLAILLATHFLGDFTPFATARMQRAKAAGRPAGPIAAHALVHACLVGIAVTVASEAGRPLTATVMGIELATHFGMDWARGALGARNPILLDPGSQLFWTALGLDQLAHGLVLVWIAYLVA